jgi:hypothetical protein
MSVPGKNTWLALTIIDNQKPARLRLSMQMHFKEERALIVYLVYVTRLHLFRCCINLNLETGRYSFFSLFLFLSLKHARLVIGCVLSGKAIV